MAITFFGAMKSKKKSKGQQCDWFPPVALIMSTVTTVLLLWLAMDRFQNSRTTTTWPVWRMLPVHLSGVCTGERNMFYRAEPQTWKMERDALACTVQDEMNNGTQWLSMTLPEERGPHADTMQWAIATHPQAYPPFLVWNQATNSFTIQWPPKTLRVGNVVNLVGAIEVMPPPTFAVKKLG